MGTEAKRASINHVFYRRARGAFDGVPGTYGVLRGRKFLLDEELAKMIETEAAELASRPGHEIGQVIEMLLEADAKRTATKLFLAALMREPTAYDPARATDPSEANVPANCDECRRSLSEIGFFFDACTTENAQWAYVCPPCFFKFGCGVGEGYGQLYQVRGDHGFMILGQGQVEHAGESADAKMTIDEAIEELNKLFGADPGQNL